MKRFFSIFTVLFAVMFTALFAFAQVTAPPETVEGATSLVPKLIEALVAGNYNVAGGIVLMILMVAVRQYALPKWELSADLLPIITAVIGAVAMGGLSMMNGVEIGEALKNGLIMAIFAGGTWSLIGKYLAMLILGDKYVESGS